jgi:hypothetical protein
MAPTIEQLEAMSEEELRSVVQLAAGRMAGEPSGWKMGELAALGSRARAGASSRRREGGVA